MNLTTQELILLRDAIDRYELYCRNCGIPDRANQAEELGQKISEELKTIRIQQNEETP